MMRAAVGLGVPLLMLALTLLIGWRSGALTRLAGAINGSLVVSH